MKYLTKNVLFNHLLSKKGRVNYKKRLYLMIFVTFLFAHLSGSTWQMKRIYWVVSDLFKQQLIQKHLKTIYSKKSLLPGDLNPRNALICDKKAAPTCAEPDAERCMQDQRFQSNSDFW